MTKNGLLINESNLQDATFEFERKRNRPERYDRNLTENTLKAIKTIDKVRSRREETHLKNRYVFLNLFGSTLHNPISAICLSIA